MNGSAPFRSGGPDAAVVVMRHLVDDPGIKEDGEEGRDEPEADHGTDARPLQHRLILHPGCTLVLRVCGTTRQQSHLA